jgi:peroxiredoxin Q/BCP
VLRRVLTTAAAIAQGIAHALLGTYKSPVVGLTPGDRAPDFTLTGSDGRTYRLSDYAGRSAVVVAWFPKAFTGGCTAECRSLGSSGDALRRFGVQYFAASVDPPGTNAEFAASLGADYPILSDPTRAVARAYGVLGKSGFAERWTFFIGRDGRILAIDRQVSAATHGAAIVERLKALGVQQRT